jgi:hypothetical protein
MDQPDDLLQAVAETLAGEGGCCQIYEEDGRCCMTERAKDIFEVIGQRTGLDYEWLLGAERITQDKKRRKAEAAT